MQSLLESLEDQHKVQLTNRDLGAMMQLLWSELYVKPN